MVTLQDNAYGMIRWKQAADGYPDFGMTFGNPDLVAYAKSYGINGSRVDSAEGLVPTLEAAFAAGGVQLIAAGQPRCGLVGQPQATAPAIDRNRAKSPALR